MKQWNSKQSAFAKVDTTVLNSRLQYLLPANPVFGRYDDMKQASEQIEFQSTILSRFDCIFCVEMSRRSRR